MHHSCKTSDHNAKRYSVSMENQRRFLNIVEIVKEKIELQSSLINILDIVQYYHMIVFVLNKNSGIVVICHEEMTWKRGGECHGNKYDSISVDFQYFGGKILHYSIMMMSLCYITNDIISLSQDYK